MFFRNPKQHDVDYQNRTSLYGLVCEFHVGSYRLGGQVSLQ